MEINKKDRATLKAYFKKNAVPTESNFGELIDSALNQKDDGIVKLPGDPLSIAATGDSNGPQKVINFYTSFSDQNPAWTLQLNPFFDQNNSATAKSGFSISDGQGNSKLFIDKSSGNVGVGTVNPATKLDVANLVRIGLDEGGSGPRSLTFAKDVGDEINAGKITYKGGFGNALNIVGAGAANSARQINLFDNVRILGSLQVNTGISNASGLLIAQTNANDWLRINPTSQFPAIALHNPVAIGNGGLSIGDWSQLPSGDLKVTGVITSSSTSASPAKNQYGVPAATSGIRFQDNPGGGGYDAAWIQYYARSGESCTLEIGVSNDADDHIALMPSGNVGIGTISPGAKLDIVANSLTWGGWLEAIRFSRNEHSAITHPGGGLLFGMHSNRNFYFADTINGHIALTIDGASGNTTIKGSITTQNSDIYFTNTQHNFTGFGDTAGYAAIENAKNYDALMILGRAGTDKGRKVKLWDYLQVNGTLEVTGTIGTNGFSAKAKKAGWGGGIHTWDVEAEGTIWSAGGIDTKPHDLAENYFSHDELEPGDVVCLDGNRDGVVKSSKPMDRAVLGIISTKPGVLLNAEHDDEERTDGKKAYPLALSGRVPCKVTDENGPIQPGDLLVSSSTPGYAMKASSVKVNDFELHVPGTVLGKALEPMTLETGVIEVFVMLK